MSAPTVMSFCKKLPSCLEENLVHEVPQARESFFSKQEIAEAFTYTRPRSNPQPGNARVNDHIVVFKIKFETPCLHGLRADDDVFGEIRNEHEVVE